MKLTDLNIDCLDNILEYLELDDLLNAATANKRLNKAANFIYDRDYGKKQLYCQEIHRSRHRSVDLIDDLIIICDLRTNLQLIRCFGEVIFNIYLTLSTQSQSMLGQYTLNYINKYCSDTLLRIGVDNGQCALQHLSKPFSRVQDVTLGGLQIVDGNTINRLFPKMRKLECSFDFHQNSILANANHFPNLKTLDIHDDTYFGFKFNGDIMVPLLHLNSQLECLNIATKRPIFESSAIQNALKTLKNLQILSFELDKPYTFDGVISLEHVKELKITLDGYYNTAKIPFLFPQLKQLDIKCSSYRLHNKFFDFIDEHPTIENLLIHYNRISAMDASKIAKSLPFLVSVHFDAGMSAHDAIQFLLLCQNLESFCFTMIGIYDYEQFKEYLSFQWDCELQKYDCVTMKKITSQAE